MMIKWEVSYVKYVWWNIITTYLERLNYIMWLEKWQLPPMKIMCDIDLRYVNLTDEVALSPMILWYASIQEFADLLILLMVGVPNHFGRSVSVSWYAIYAPSGSSTCLAPSFVHRDSFWTSMVYRNFMLPITFSKYFCSHSPESIPIRFRYLNWVNSSNIPSSILVLVSSPILTTLRSLCLEQFRILLVWKHNRVRRFWLIGSWSQSE